MKIKRDYPFFLSLKSKLLFLLLIFFLKEALPTLSGVTLGVTNNQAEKKNLREVKKFRGSYDYYAPDSSKIKKLAAANHGDMAYCTLPVGKVSFSIQHKTVEELWYIRSGKGELWLKGNKEEGKPDQIITLEENLTFLIPPARTFQFKNTGDVPLDIIITTMPRWPGPEEAVKVEQGFYPIPLLKKIEVRH